MRLSKIAFMTKYYLQAKFFGVKRPILAGVKLTHNCTLKCRQCPYWRRPVPNLPWSKMADVMQSLYLDGVRILILEGGEPLLWSDEGKDINDVINLARRYFFSIGVTTNGTLPLDQINPDLIWVSIDGLKETHDSLRGESFDKIIHNIQSSNHPNVFANITINKLNHLEIPQLVKYLKEYVKGITIQFFYPYEESDDLLLPAEDRVKVLDQLLTLKKEGYPVVDSEVALNALKNNTWTCESWMVANVEPDGTINRGCYLKNRLEKESCQLCGFAAHTEISLAYQLNWEAIMTGHRIFKLI